MQIERKTHSPVTIRFPDYSFNEPYLVLFSQMKCFLNYTFSYDTQKCKKKSPLSLENKRNFCLCDFQ